jgi:hypothetical protein
MIGASDLAPAPPDAAPSCSPSYGQPCGYPEATEYRTAKPGADLRCGRGAGCGHC